MYCWFDSYTIETQSKQTELTQNSNGFRSDSSAHDLSSSKGKVFPSHQNFNCNLSMTLFFDFLLVFFQPKLSFCYIFIRSWLLIKITGIARVKVEEENAYIARVKWKMKMASIARVKWKMKMASIARVKWKMKMASIARVNWKMKMASIARVKWKMKMASIARV